MKKIEIPTPELRGVNEKVTQCGRMISDFRVEELESKLMIQATTWDENLESKLTILVTTWDDKIQIRKLELRGVNDKVTQCQRQGSEGHDPPHALKFSQCGRMILDFRVSNLERKLTIQATTWDEKIQIPKLELRGVNEKVR